MDCDLIVVMKVGCQASTMLCMHECGNPKIEGQRIDSFKSNHFYAFSLSHFGSNER